MNLKKPLTLTLLLTFLIIGACERKSRPQAARKDAARIPQVMSEEAGRLESHKVAQIAGIQDVLPQAQGKSGPIDGQALFAANCVACHQATGQGIPGVFPPLVQSPYVTSENTERLAAIMLYGLMGPIEVLGTTYNNVMTAVGITAKLSNEELAAIANYIRTSWGNNGAKVEPSVFEETRTKYGARGPFNIQELGEEK